MNNTIYKTLLALIASCTLTGCHGPTSGTDPNSRPLGEATAVPSTAAKDAALQGLAQASFDADLQIDTPIPDRVDHRDRQSPVKDQGDRPTCLAHAVAAVLEAQGQDPQEDLSEQDLHAQFIDINRRHDPTFDPETGGIHIATLERNFHDLSLCPEQDAPYSHTSHTSGITPQSRSRARVRISHVERLRRPRIETLERLLASDLDVILQVNGDWRLQASTPRGLIDLGGDTTHHQSHYLLVVGYDRGRDVLIVKNSFGTSWGDNGYNYITYRYVREHAHNAAVVTRASGSRQAAAPVGAPTSDQRGV